MVRDGLKVRSLVINANDDIYAGAWNGVFRSTDNWDTWTEINSGLIEEDIQTLAINPEGYLFAGVGNVFYPEGVFRTVKSTTDE